MSYTRDGDDVTLTMTVEQYESLMMVFGYAIGTMAGRGQEFKNMIILANALNLGNVNWRPYKVDQ